MVSVKDAINILASIHEDTTVPKNVRSKIEISITSLQDTNGKSTAIKIDQVIQQLDELSDDPNLEPHTRTQIWNAVSTLESRS